MRKKEKWFYWFFY